MDKMGKKLTDRELIEVVLAWYELDQSSDELREAVAAYLQQYPAVAPALSSGISFEEQGANALARPNTDCTGSKPIIPVSKSETNDFEPNEVTYKPQFEPTDELIGSRGWMIDAWAVYYGIEEFFHRISFGLVSMQTLAVLFCILISAVVMVGAWQSTLSTERQKKATFKSMVIEPSDKTEKTSVPPEMNAPPEPSDSLAASEPTETSSHTIVTSTSVTPDASETTGTEFGPAIRLMEKAAWNDALANLQSLEEGGGSDLEPLLTLMRIEALIQKRDTVSMELARQLLMDCKWGKFDTVYDLLVTRWMMLGAPEDRKRFLNEAASLPNAARRRMSTWARVRNGSKDAMTEVMLETNASKGQSEVCDLLFIASFHFNVGKFDETIRELLDTQQKLRALQASGKSTVENWLLESAKSQLVSKVDDILNMISSQPRKEIN